MFGVERWRNLAGRLLWCLAVVLGLRLAILEARVVDRRANGFVAYYTSARLLTEGEDPVQFYDRPWFQRQVERFEPTVLEVFWATPPTMSLLGLPLTGLGYHSARAVWVSISFLSVVATVAWLLAALRLSGLWAPAFVCFVFLYDPLALTLEHGQFYAMGLALLVIVFHGYRTGRDLATGVPLGFVLITKNAGLLIWPLLAIKKRWRAIAWGVGTTAAMILASWPWMGRAAWGRYLRDAFELTQNRLLAVAEYQTVFGFFHHLFGVGGPPIGDPLIQLPVLATALTWIASAALLGSTALAARRSGRSDLAFAAFVLLGLMITPVTGESHFTLALLPIAVLVAEAQQRNAWFVLPVFAGALLIAADLSYPSPGPADGLLALEAYPKLYGALLLWGLALWASSGRPLDRPDTDRTSARPAEN
jgi:hypothetical protein